MFIKNLLCLCKLHPVDAAECPKKTPPSEVIDIPFPVNVAVTKLTLFLAQIVNKVSKITGNLLYSRFHINILYNICLNRRKMCSYSQAFHR